MNPNIILASKSVHRKMLMQNAGLTFDTASANIDERVIEDTIQETGVTPQELAIILANAKALDVSQTNPDQYVIGSDQTLSFEDGVLHKAADMEEARRRLLQLSGKTHQLNSAVVIVKDGQTLWQHVSTAQLTMRELTPEFIGRHLAQAGDDILSSVGAYQLEKEGVQLFDKIEGDFFTIIGLPMLPLLQELRNLGVIDG